MGIHRRVGIPRWRDADPRDRLALAVSLFERNGVLGVNRVWVEPTREARYHGLAEAFGPPVPPSLSRSSGPSGTRPQLPSADPRLTERRRRPSPSHRAAADQIACSIETASKLDSSGWVCLSFGSMPPTVTKSLATQHLQNRWPLSQPALPGLTPQAGLPTIANGR